MNDWEAQWSEGLEALDAIQVGTERLKHRLAVAEEILFRLDELAAQEATTNKGFMARLLQGVK